MTDEELDFASVTARSMSKQEEMYAFLNRVRSLFNIDHYLLPELNEHDWRQFRDDPPRYFINHADLPQMRAIWREVEKRQK